MWQCRAVAHEFLGCIEVNQRDYSACKDLSKAYLQCRMDKVDRLVVGDGEREKQGRCLMRSFVMVCGRCLSPSRPRTILPHPPTPNMFRT